MLPTSKEDIPYLKVEKHMKIPRNILVLSSFVITFVFLLIVAAVTGTLFEPFPVKTLLIAAYFAGWVALLVFCVCTFLLPQVQAAGGLSAMFLTTQKKQESQKNVEYPHPTEEIPKRSPRSDLPVRERIAAYVAERRREEGIPAPAPLRQNSPEEKQDVSSGRSFSPSFVASAATAATAAAISTPSAPSAPSYEASSVSDTETLSEFDGELEFDLVPDIGVEIESNKDADEFPEFDGNLNLNTRDGEDVVGADDLDSFVDANADAKDFELDESFDDASEELLEFDTFIDDEELLLSDDDFEDIGEIIDLEPDDMSKR